MGLGFDGAAVFFGNSAELGRHAQPGARRGVDGQIVFARENAHAANVIGMLVGDENSGKGARIHAHVAQRLSNPRAG